MIDLGICLMFDEDVLEGFEFYFFFKGCNVIVCGVGYLFV